MPHQMHASALCRASLLRAHSTRMQSRACGAGVPPRLVPRLARAVRLALFLVSLAAARPVSFVEDAEAANATYDYDDGGGGDGPPSPPPSLPPSLPADLREDARARRELQSSGGSQCISFDFEFAYILHNNLGGQGPDTDLPNSMRFANVGAM